MNFEKKYLKYKKKYLKLKNKIRYSQAGGSGGGGGGSGGGWQCEICTLLNNNETKICDACGSVKKVLPEWVCDICTLSNEDEAKICAVCGNVRKEQEKRRLFLQELNRSDAKYLNNVTGFKAVATPHSYASPSKSEPVIGSHGWFLRHWIDLSDIDKKIISETYNGRYRFNVSISPDIQVGNMVVFYLVEPLTTIATKYGYSLVEAIRILHDVSLGGLPQNRAFIQEAFNDDFMAKAGKR